MARPRRMTREEVLDRALDVFWQHGYEGTSVQDLVEATGLGRGSLYGTFADKESLFLEVLDHYDRQVSARYRNALTGGGCPRAALQKFLSETAARMTCGSCPPGCLKTMAAMEECPDRVRERVARDQRALEDALDRLFAEAIAAGHLAAATETRALARFFVGITQALAVASRLHGDRETLDDIIRVGMSVWPPAADHHRA